MHIHDGFPKLPMFTQEIARYGITLSLVIVIYFGYVVTRRRSDRDQDFANIAAKFGLQVLRQANPKSPPAAFGGSVQRLRMLRGNINGKAIVVEDQIVIPRSLLPLTRVPNSSYFPTSTNGFRTVLQVDNVCTDISNTRFWSMSALASPESIYKILVVKFIRLSPPQVHISRSFLRRSRGTKRQIPSTSRLLKKGFGGIATDRLCSIEVAYRAWSAADCRWKSSRRNQLGDSDQIVGCGREGEGPSDPIDSPELGSRLAANDLDPAECLLDALSDTLAGRVARMPGRPCVDRGA